MQSVEITGNCNISICFVAFGTNVIFVLIEWIPENN